MGQGDNYKNHPGLQDLTIPNDLPNNCNYSDLRSDGDAIAIAEILKEPAGNHPNLLSRVLQSYYNNQVTLSRRLKKIAENVGATDQHSAETTFYDEIERWLDNKYVGLLTDGHDGAAGYSDVEISKEVKQAACRALAEFIY